MKKTITTICPLLYLIIALTTASAALPDAGDQFSAVPPSTLIVWPVMYEAPLPSRKCIGAATSSG